MSATLVIHKCDMSATSLQHECDMSTTSSWATSRAGWGAAGATRAWRRRRRVILFLFFCASTVLTVCSVFHKHQIVTEGENHLTDQIGRRGAVVALTSFLFPARGGGAVGHGAPRAGERMKSTRRQLARLQGEGGESSMKLRDWTGQGATRVRDGRRFSFWYSQTVFIFLCTDCLESNLVSFYSS